MTTFASMDSEIGLAISRGRAAVNMSQQALAEAVRRRGFDFHQQTIGKIERGERRVTVGEAFAIADVLQIELGDLFADRSSSATEPLRKAHTNVALTMQRLEGAAYNYARAAGAFRRSLDALRGSDLVTLEEGEGPQIRSYIRMLESMEIRARDEAIDDVIEQLAKSKLRPDDA